MIKKWFYTFYKNTNATEKAHFIVINFLRITLIGAIISSIITQTWTVLFISSLVFILTFFPYYFERYSKIDLPIEFEILTVLFLYASIFLGEVHDYYTLYWWWDAVLHAGSAMAFGFVGFTIMYVLYKGDRIYASPRVIALFSFCFALAIGASWEIFEFAMDQIFGLNMQKSGLVDTMWDLILDAAGAFIASFLGYWYIRDKNLFFLGKIMKDFVNKNPELFK